MRLRGKPEVQAWYMDDFLGIGFTSLVEWINLFLGYQYQVSIEKVKGIVKNNCVITRMMVRKTQVMREVERTWIDT